MTIYPARIWEWIADGGFAYLAIAGIACAVVGSIGYAIWWNTNYVCVKSHQETVLVSYCAAYDSKGNCIVTSWYPSQETVCDKAVHR